MSSNAQCSVHNTSNDAENNPTLPSEHVVVPENIEIEIEKNPSCPPPLASAQQKQEGQRLQRKNNSAGMILVFLSTLCFSIGNTFVNMIGKRIPALQITFLRATTQLIISVLLIGAMAGSRRHVASTWIGAPENRIKMFARGFLGIVALVTLFACLQVAQTRARTLPICRQSRVSDPHRRRECPWPTPRP